MASGHAQNGVVGETAATRPLPAGAAPVSEPRVTGSVGVVLTWFEMFQAATVGSMRQIEALKRGRPDRHGYEGDGWGVHINGATAELAVAKATGLFWHALHREPTQLPGDVGRLQVRWRSKRHWDLIVHDNDPDDAAYVLVVGDAPKLTIVGWIRGAEAKQSRWWKDPAGGRPAYFVPQGSLGSFADLLEEGKIDLSEFVAPESARGDA